MKVSVIGGGASGLMAALTAAQNGHDVTLWEAQNRVGRKLSVTGNGRCNLTNEHISFSHYHGADENFPRPAIHELAGREAVALFQSLGLVTVSEPDGRVYPLSNQASSVVDILRFACENLGVCMKTDCRVAAICPGRGGFTVRTEAESLCADRVIVCCGGAAGSRYGGCEDGYDLLSSLGHTRTDLSPSLVPIRTDHTWVRPLKGVRADAELSVLSGGHAVAVRAGEVQFTDYGLSGPAVFDVSRVVSAGGGDQLSLDLMRGFSTHEVETILREKQYHSPSLTNENLLTGMLHNRLGRTLLRSGGYRLNHPISALTEEDIAHIARIIKDFRLKLLGVMGFDAAQVTAGGVRTAEFDPQTLCSRKVPGLYAAGEVLDVDGDCGGFNLQWAWASGRLAGKLR